MRKALQSMADDGGTERAPEVESTAVTDLFESLLTPTGLEQTDDYIEILREAEKSVVRGAVLARRALASHDRRTLRNLRKTINQAKGGKR
jgi:hypothetical protein